MGCSARVRRSHDKATPWKSAQGKSKNEHLCLLRSEHFALVYCSTPNMTGRPGYRTMEMNGGSSVPYLARTPCIPLFCTSFCRGGNRRAFRLPGAGGGSFPLYGGTFVRSYSVSNCVCCGHEELLRSSFVTCPLRSLTM